MDIYQPRSFFGLVLIGFALVVVPLTAGLINAARSVNQLTEQSQRIVHDAVQATQNSRLAVQQIVAMERTARQFAVLGDPGLHARYRELHGRFEETAEALARLPLDDPQRAQLATLVASERALYERLQAAGPQAVAWREAPNEFGELLALARALLEASDRLIERELTALQHAAGGAERLLIGQAVGLVPAALLLIGLFAFLISRPIKQMDRAIRRLGDGEFRTPVAIKGPRDLEYLGGRLEWLRARLAELEEEKRKFLRHVSHELKTPLSAIREGSELLNEEVLGRLNPQQREVAEILQHNCAYLQRLIEDLLSLNFTATRPAPARRELLALHETVRSVAERYKLALRKKEIRLDLALEPVAVSGEAQKLATVIDNLLSNAVKFTPVRGTIRVALAAADGFASLDVTDSGPGVAPDDQVRVFDAFYQGRRQVPGHVKGTGLGLAIAKEYVVAHDGHIELRDDVQTGAHFRVYLPLLDEDVRCAS